MAGFTEVFNPHRIVIIPCQTGVEWYIHNEQYVPADSLDTLDKGVFFRLSNKYNENTSLINRCYASLKHQGAHNKANCLLVVTNVTIV